MPYNELPPEIYTHINIIKRIFDSLRRKIPLKPINEFKIYKNSYVKWNNTEIVLLKYKSRKLLLAHGDSQLFHELDGTLKEHYKFCELTHANRLVLNTFCEYTKPVSLGKETASIGLGDRIGLATPGHIKILRGRNILPVFAQQSTRELDLTGRDYDEVLDTACFAVFQEGYTGGFGADGDHLKNSEEVKTSIDKGITMVTLDCSEKIDNCIYGLDAMTRWYMYNQFPLNLRNYYEDRYVGIHRFLGESLISIGRKDVMEFLLVYKDIIDFIVYIFQCYIAPREGKIDFEVSVDETGSPTTPEAHYILACELEEKNIALTSLAPRFPGLFEKGIDYRGSIGNFEADFKIHAAIADRYGYKLSIHSGSDKFTVYPVIGKYTKGRFHLKTAGTSWLEAVRLIAVHNPSLYRKMYTFALENFESAKKHYSVSTDIRKIPKIGEIEDRDLPALMDNDNARQLMHISYGLILQAGVDDKYLFRNEFYKTIMAYEDDYNDLVFNHIKKHLDLLGI